MASAPRLAAGKEVEPVVMRDPVAVQEAWRGELVYKREAYKHQMEMMGRLVGILDEQILEVNARLKVMRSR